MVNVKEVFVGLDVEDFIGEYILNVAEEALRNSESIQNAVAELLNAYAIAETSADVSRVCASIQDALIDVTPIHQEMDRQELSAPIRIGDNIGQYKAEKQRTGRRDRDVVLKSMKEEEMEIARPVRPEVRKKYEKDDTGLIVSGKRGAGGSRDVNIDGLYLSPRGGGGDYLLENTKLKLAVKRRYALIGRNGVGKTTLLTGIASRQIKGIPEGLRIIAVKQEISGSEKTVVEEVVAIDTERSELIEQENLIIQGKIRDPKGILLEQIHEKLNEIDAWGAEARASEILAGLGFITPESRAQLTKDLSGGWRMRVSLAAALFMLPEVLLLDEPTNHLDFPSVLWLENYLKEYPGIVMLVSHDRVFVNNVSSDVIHFYNKELNYYKGNYDDFENAREERLKQQSRQKEAFVRRQKHMQSFIDRFRYNAKRASLVQSRIKSLRKLESTALDLDPDEESEFRFEFPNPEPIDKFIVSIDNVTFGYNPKLPSLLKHLSLRLSADSRVGIVGRNGTGKSTLLKLMTGELEPVSGQVDRNRRARISLFAQHHMDQLDMGSSPMEYMMDHFPKETSLTIKIHLGRYGIVGELLNRAIGDLSGGQKSRVAFSSATINRPHLLILDEPTNHCDLETVEALLLAIDLFDGGVVAVSHDQHFLSSFATEFWALDNQKMRIFDSFAQAKRCTYRDTLQ